MQTPTSEILSNLHHFAEQAFESDKSDSDKSKIAPFVSMAMAARHEHTRILQELRAASDSARRELTRVVDALDRDGPDASINSLGILQSRGPDIDRLAGQLELASKNARNVHELLERAGMLDGIA